MPALRASGSPLWLVLLLVLVALPCRPDQGAVAPGPATPPFSDSSRQYSRDILATACDIYLPLSQRLSPVYGYPRSIIEGTEWDQRQPYEWTSGFFAGILWQLYGLSHDEELLEQGMRWTEGLEEQATAPTHDVGFMINNSFGQGYRAAGIEEYRSVTLKAAEHLATRFDPDVGAIRAWGAMKLYSYPVIIDGMMNIEILFWAARNGGGQYLADVARTHAMTTMRDHVRPDGTTFQLVDYDPDTGDQLWRGTVQGYSDASTWARGQAWAIYGFTVAYRETGEPLFLETGCRAADAFLERLPEDWVPCWDFDAALVPDEPKDVSAAAVAASGLWDLAALVDDPALMLRYRDASLALVAELTSEFYSAHAVGLPALLLHGTGNRPANREVDVPLIYAEYYFIEAVAKQQSTGSGSWSPELSLCSYPNPFAGETLLECRLPSPSEATLRVYDASGGLVDTLPVSAVNDGAVRSVAWDGCDSKGRRMPSGIYFACLETGEARAFHKVVLLR